MRRFIMFLYATILATFIAIYVIVRAVFPLSTHWGNKLALSLITAAAAYKFHLFYLLEGRNFFTPNLPAELVWSGCWLFCAVFAFALLLLAAESIPASIQFPLISGGVIVLSAVVSVLIFRETVTRREWLCIGGAFLSTFLYAF